MNVNMNINVLSRLTNARVCQSKGLLSFISKALRTKGFVSKSFVFVVSLFVSVVVLPLLPFVPNALPNLFLAGASTQGSGVQFVAPAWVAQNANDPNLRILDVRINPFDYFTSHIPNAVHIADNTFRGPNGTLPVQYWQPEKLQALFTQAGVTDDSKVLIYSDGRDFLGATMVAYLLERTGHTNNIAVLDGGFAGYKAAQLPVTKAFPQYTLGKFGVRDNTAIRVSLNQVKSLIGKPGVTFIDPRPPEIFAGQQDIWVRNGHIPGAKNIPWVSFTVGESNFHQLKSLDEIRQILAERNVQPTDDIIITCSTGREATLQYNVLKHVLGYPKVRIYEGSWTEYSAQSDLPIATGAGA